MGLAGFASVAVALRRGSGEWAPADAIRTRVMLHAAFLAFFGSLFAAASHWAGLSSGSAIRVGSAVLLGGGLYGLGASLVRLRRVDLSQHSALSPGVGWALRVGALLGIATQGIVVAGGFPGAWRALFLYGLLWHLVLAAFVLVRILFVRPDEA